MYGHSMENKNIITSGPHVHIDEVEQEARETFLERIVWDERVEILGVPRVHVEGKQEHAQLCLGAAVEAAPLLFLGGKKKRGLGDRRRRRRRCLHLFWVFVSPVDGVLDAVSALAKGQGSAGRGHVAHLDHLRNEVIGGG